MKLSHLVLGGITALSTACELPQEQPVATPSPVASTLKETLHRQLPTSVAPPRTAKELPARLATIQERYGLHIELTPDYNFHLAKALELYDDRPELLPFITPAAIHQYVRPLSPEAAHKALDTIETQLGYLPPHMLKALGPRRLLVVNGEMMRAEKNGKLLEFIILLRDQATPDGTTIQMSFTKKGENLDDNMLHEFFHIFDHNAAGNWTRDFDRWIGTSTPMGKKQFADPQYRECTKDLMHGDENILRTSKECRELFRKVLHGYVHTYGLIRSQDVEQGEHRAHVEDKAMLGSTLLQPGGPEKLSLQWALERAAEDQQVRTKVKMMTGCDVNLQRVGTAVHGKFTRLLSLQEYNALVQKGGHPVKPAGFDYFRKWSTDAKGNVLMGPDYYNAILENKPMTWSSWQKR